MIHKYELTKNEEAGIFIIKEYGLLEKDMFTFLSEISYDLNELMNRATSQSAMIQAIRSHQMYPPEYAVVKIVETALRMLETPGEVNENIMVDDIDVLVRDDENVDVALEDDNIDVDDLLEDNDDDFDDDDLLDEEKLKNSPLKIAEDDNIESDEG